MYLQNITIWIILQNYINWAPTQYIILCTPISQNIKPLTGEVNNTDPLITIQCSPGKSRILAFYVHAPTWNSHPKTVAGQVHPLMATALRNSSASKSPLSQSDWAYMGYTSAPGLLCPCLDRWVSCGVLESCGLWGGLLWVWPLPARCMCLIRLGSGEIRGQVAALSSV